MRRRWFAVLLVLVLVWAGTSVASEFQGPVNRLRAGRATVASASSITATADILDITGTTNIQTIVTTDTTGRRITLVFSTGLTVLDGAGNIQLDDNFLTSAGSTLTLVSDGTNWNEVGRSSNTAATSTSPSCLDIATGTKETLNGSYNGSTGVPSLTRAGTVSSARFDARTATFKDADFIQPVVLSGSAGLCWYGGQVQGDYPVDPGWKYMHDGDLCSNDQNVDCTPCTINADCVAAGGTTCTSSICDNACDAGATCDSHDRNHGGIEFSEQNATIENAWVNNNADGIRVRNPSGGVNSNFTIKGVELTDIHDDCIDDHEVQGGTISDVLMDGCYVGLSTRSNDADDGSARTVAITNSFMRLKPWAKPHPSEALDPGHGGFFKLDSNTPTRNPSITINNVWFFVEEQTSSGATNEGIGIQAKMEAYPGFRCTGVNKVFWIPRPGQSSTYPGRLGTDPVANGGDGHTCLTVSYDRTEWDAALAAWRATHPRGGGSVAAGTLSGTGSQNFGAYWTGPNAIASDGGFKFDPGSDQLQSKFVDEGGANLDVRATGAVCDGVTDDETKIQAAITLAATTSQWALIPSGKTCIVGDGAGSNTAGMTFPANTRLRVAGTIKVKDAESQSFVMFTADEASKTNIKVWLDGGTLDGNNANRSGGSNQSGHGIVVSDGASDVELYGPGTIKNMDGDGVSILRNNNSVKSIDADIKIHDLRFSTNGRYGVRIDGQRVRVNNNTFDNNVSTAIRMAPGAGVDTTTTNTFDDLVIQGNIIADSPDGIILSGVSEGAVKRPVITDNRITIPTTSTNTGITCINCQNFVIARNQLFKKGKCRDRCNGTTLLCYRGGGACTVSGQSTSCALASNTDCLKNSDCTNNERCDFVADAIALGRAQTCEGGSEDGTSCDANGDCAGTGASGIGVSSCAGGTFPCCEDYPLTGGIIAQNLIEGFNRGINTQSTGIGANSYGRPLNLTINDNRFETIGTNAIIIDGQPTITSSELAFDPAKHTIITGNAFHNTGIDDDENLSATTDMTAILIQDADDTLIAGNHYEVDYTIQQGADPSFLKTIQIESGSNHGINTNLVVTNNLVTFAVPTSRTGMNFVDVGNAACKSSGSPAACCTGAGTGTCLGARVANNQITAAKQVLIGTDAGDSVQVFGLGDKTFDVDTQALPASTTTQYFRVHGADVAPITTTAASVTVDFQPPTDIDVFGYACGLSQAPGGVTTRSFVLTRVGGSDLSGGSCTITGTQTSCVHFLTTIPQPLLAGQGSATARGYIRWKQTATGPPTAAFATCKVYYNTTRW